MYAIYWLRNDLRLFDNKTLNQFAQNETKGIFIFAENPSLKRAAGFRKKFIFSELSRLNSELSEFGQSIYMSEHSFKETLINLLKNIEINSVYFSQEYAVEEIDDKNEVEKFCRNNNIMLHGYRQSTLVELEDLPFSLSNMPLVFTDFRKRIEANLSINPPAKEIVKLPSPPSIEVNIDLKKLECTHKLNNEGIQRVLYYFFETKKILTYKETRNGLIDHDDSTHFSRWINVGSISPKYIYHQIKKFEQDYHANESTYWVFFELLWRDYFKFFSLKYKNKIFLIQGISSKNKDFTPNEKLLLKWQQGQTGEPFVDANMRELNATGNMSNRGRQNVASYLIHDLKIPWTLGASYFEKMLIDYDPDVNYGNWLYLSGNGSDPRSRKFNIKKQANDYDPDELYQKKWLL